MATITSTIKLVDQMTPALNKISKAIDNVSKRAGNIGTSMEKANARASASAQRHSNAMLRYIEQIKAKQGQFNATLNRTHSIANGVTSAFRRLLATLGLAVGIRNIVETADSMMNATARLNNLTGNLAETQHYLDVIYASAQRSRGSFIGMANSVGKLGTVAGDAFGNVEEMIAFTELLNKLFVLSGSSATESSSAMYQLTQAMAAGKLQGDEMRSILENAPLLARKIADSLGVTTGELKELGANGEITAEIIKEALFDAADEIEEKFEKMPKTIGQTWTEICNHALNAFRPVIDRVQQFINSPTFERFKKRIFAIIDTISKGIIKIFDLLETPRIQNALSKIGAAFSALWEVVCWVGNLMVNVARWICDNWSWISPIVYTIVWAFLIYKTVMFAVTAATWAYNAAQLVMTILQSKTLLIIIALIAVIYLAVAAWNHFTGQTVSATGIIFGAIAFVIAGIIDIFVFLWDIFMSVVHIIVAVGKIVWQVATNIGQFIKSIFANIFIFFIALIASVQIIWHTVSENVSATFDWLMNYLTIWAANMLIGMEQLTSELPAYWEYFKASVIAKFWALVVGAGEAFNNLLVGCSNITKSMVKPFENFANAVIDIFNGIIRGWNSVTEAMTLTIPELSIMGKKVFNGQTIKFLGSGFTELGKVSWTDWDDPSGIHLGTAKSHLAAALLNQKNHAVKPINWGTIPTPDYNVDWSTTGTGLKHLWSNIEWMDSGVDFKGVWNELLDNLDKTWDSSQYTNPVDAFKTWYDKGEAVEGGINGAVDFIGGLLDGLFGTSGTPVGDKVKENIEKVFGDKGGNGNKIPQSTEDLLNGYTPSGAGDGLKDLLGAIADNTGKTADSTGNIEDNLNLAEEELELLRKLAEQEAINRFTTAEIHVDMTNNNNINSKMDLDGIVTHLSNKLYEELGVVASGVHY